MTEQPGLELGRQLRDEGIKRTTEAQAEDWLSRYHMLAARFCEDLRAGDRFTGEDLRAYIQSHGQEQPSHQNAWSAAASSVLRAWLRDRKIAQDGVGQCERPEAHARLIRKYRKTKL